MGTVVSTTLYGPKDSPYIESAPAFVASLARQSTQEFDVICSVAPHLEATVQGIFNEHAPDIANNGRLHFSYMLPIDGREPDNLIATYSRFNHLSSEPPSDYDCVILLDVDDTVPEDYVATIASTMESTGADIVTADLHTTGSTTSPPGLLSSTLDNEQAITFDMILNRNCMAFSNVAICPQTVLPGNYEDIAGVSPHIIPAPDWFVFMRAVAKGGKAVFTSDTRLNYAQHDDNLSGITRTDSPAIQAAVKLKNHFYPAVIQEDMPAEHRARLQELAGTFQRMEQTMFSSSANGEFNQYVDYVGQWRTGQERDHFWWWELARPFKNSPEEVLEM